MTRVALAVSPHLDDAAFSAGGTLAALAARGWRVVVATVFTATVPDPQGFALACQLDKGLGPEVDYMALRRAEDRAACAALGAEALHLPLKEAPHRGYGSAAELFGPTRADDEASAAVAELLDILFEDFRPDLLLAPQSVGAHVDHRAVTGALLDRAPRPPTVWWRDFPYTIRPGFGVEPFACRFASLPEVDVRHDAGAAAAKEAACAAYASQLGFQFGGLEGLQQALRRAGPAERSYLDGAAAARLSGADLRFRPNTREEPDRP